MANLNKKGKEVNNKEKKISYFKLFFTKYTIWGIIIILVSVVIDLCNSKNIFWLNILKNCFSTFGCALLVGAIFDFQKIVRLLHYLFQIFYVTL